MAKQTSKQDWAIELVGELIEESMNLILSTTQTPEELIANSCFEQRLLHLYDELLHLQSIPSSTKSQLWDCIGSILVIVGLEVQNVLKNSISCFQTRGTQKRVSLDHYNLNMVSN